MGLSENGALALIDGLDGSIKAVDIACTSTLVSRERLESIFSSRLVILADAKSFLEKYRIKAHPGIRLLCLKTINLLCPKEPEISIETPLTQILEQILARDGLSQLISLECQLIPAVVWMQRKGLPFNKAAWQRSLSLFAKEAKDTKEKLSLLLKKDDGFALFGPEHIDLNNSSEVKKSLEKLLGFKIAGTSQSTLSGIDHEAVRLLLKYRTCDRMLNTYGEHFLYKVNDDRLRGEFIPIGCSSGRLSCQEPNLLALPNHPTFQACLTPTSSHKILRFDFGAFELRILAALSQDPILMDIFERGLDIHSMVAQTVFGQKVSKNENPHLRDQAKILNFGLIYGMGENSLSKQLKVPIYQAQKLFDRYFKKFSKVADFLQELEQAKKTGHTKTALGRVTYFDSSQDESRQLRVARNLPIQGTGADIIKLAICRVFKSLYNLDAFLINAVHDELVVEVNNSIEDEIKSLVTFEMEQAHKSILPNVSADVSYK